MPQSHKALPCTADEWEKLCFLLQDSMMADTSLAKLAQNIGRKWPIRGTEERPRKYIGYALDDLADLPEFYGKGTRLNLLYEILLETQAFDDPFDDMVTHFDAITEEESPPVKALQELEIPVDFPVELASFSLSTEALCEAEGLATIGQLIEFSQRCAKTVLLGGEFQRFLNALIQRDIESLRQFLPVREGRTGPFLAESIARMALRLTDEEAAFLLQRYQIPSIKPSWQNAGPLRKSEAELLLPGIQEHVSKHFTAMPDQAQQLRHAVDTSDAACVRFFAPLQDPDTESLALAVAMAGLGIKPRAQNLFKRFLNR
ncbi:MAG: hypothetical protein R6V45_13725 [Oceanipulchritudo sp.]